MQKKPWYLIFGFLRLKLQEQGIKKDSFYGFFFGAKGGFNAESHNHNDVGSCVMYFDGKPCLIDLGREEYTAKTFSSKTI